jgi:hypothetical protein
VRLPVLPNRKEVSYQLSQYAVDCCQELRSAKQGVASQTIADVFSIIPSSRSTQSKDKETLYPSLPSPFTNAHLGRHFLVCSACPSTLWCPSSFALVPSFLKTSACRSPCLKETKGISRTLDRVCHKRRCRPNHTHAYNPFEYPRIPA